MPILNYTTSVESDKSIAEITGILSRFGARSITTEYDADGFVSGISFVVMIEMRPLAIRLPVNLDGIEDVMSFMVKASQRFKKGDRVEFNAKADKRLVSERTKGGVRTGTVIAVDDGWSIKVLLDGYKHPQGYHHSFFDKVKRKRKSVEV